MKMVAKFSTIFRTPNFQRRTLRMVSSFLLLMAVTGSLSQNFDLSELVIDYIEYKNDSRWLSAFLCLQDIDAISLSRKFAESSISSMIMNPDTIWNENKTIDMLLRYDYYHINVIVDLRCERSEELIIEVSANTMFNYSYAWLLISDNQSYALDLMAGTNLSVDADVVLAIGSEVSVMLYDVYNTGSDRNGTFNATSIGTWEKSGRLEIIELDSFVYRRQNLTGITLKFAAVIQHKDPQEADLIRYLTTWANRSYDTLAKMNYAFNVMSRDFFNYTVEISAWPDFGGRWIRQPFFGMMGAVGLRNADFTLGGSVMNEGRLRYATVIAQNFPFRTSFLFKRPASHSIRNVFLEPLEPMAWNAVLALSILVILLITLVGYYYDRDSVNSWSLGIYITLATLFQQGWSDLPRGTSGHLLALVFMVFSLLLYNFYGASVVSSLLSDPPDNIKTLADLFHIGWPAAFENLSYMPHYFETSTIPGVRGLWEKRLLVKGQPNVLPRSEGIRLIKAGDFAYHTTPGDAYDEIARDFTQTDICKLTEIVFIPKTVVAIWGWHGNPYREHLKIIHRRMAEVGILNREQKRWMAPKPECLGSLVDLSSIGLTDVAPAFLGLIFGAVAAILILILELGYHSLSKKRIAEYLHHRLRKISVKQRRRRSMIVVQ